MAGAGYKLFQTGDVLTAAQVNTYLNEQTVMVFVNSAARTSALTSVLAEGMVSYLQDTNAVEVYDGSSWTAISGGGSSTITTWVKTAAGGETSLSGNDDNAQPLSYTVGKELLFINGSLQYRGSDYIATTGNTITGLAALAANDVVTVWAVSTFSVAGAIPNSIVDAKGDLIVATAADTPGRLAVGTSGQVLTVDSTTGTGLKWATPAGGGKVLQVVYGGTATTASSSSSTRADTNLTATITPSSASSKVLVLVAQSGVSKDAANTGACVNLWLMRGATDLIKFQNEAAHTNTSQRNDVGACSANYLDSPATTSATTYKTQFNSPNNVGTVYVQNGGSSTIVLLEIGA